MPGIDLELDLPGMSETQAAIIAKIVTALEAIEADLAERVTAGELDIDTNLSMGGAALTNVGGVRLIGGESDEIGTLYMDEELWIVTSAGAVKITDQGALAIAALGTIGGDFGGSNPAAVTYNDVSGEFRFTEAPGEWADIAVDDVILKGINGSVRLGVDDALSGAKTVNFKSLPTTGVTLLAYVAADDAIVDPSTDTVAIDLGGSSVTTTGNITGSTITATAELKHTFQLSKRIPFGQTVKSLGSSGAPQICSTFVQVAGTEHVDMGLDLMVGDRLISVYITGTQVNTQATEFDLLKYNAAGAVIETTSDAAEATGAFAITLTPSTPINLLEGEFYVIRMGGTHVTSTATANAAMQRWTRP